MPDDLHLLSSRFTELALIEEQPHRAQELLAGSSQLIHAAEGATLFQQESDCSAIAFLLDGRVRVYKESAVGRQITLYRVHPGEACILTTCSVLRNTPFPANASVEHSITALAVSAETFRDWFASEPCWRSFVINLFSDRLEHVLNLVDSVVFHRTDSRLARLLLAKADVSQDVARITHDEAAKEIGTAREVVSRILERFVSDGLIKTERAHIHLIDTNALSDIAGTNPN